MERDCFEMLCGLIDREFSSCGKRIIGSEENVKSAVLVPFINIGGTQSVLFEKRAEGIRQGGEVCFPGGAVDSSDCSTVSTVIRETAEETGIAPESVTVHESAGYMITRTGALIDVYIGRISVDSMDAFSPNGSEVQRLFAVPVSFFTENEPEFYNYRLTCEPWYTDDDGRRIDLFPAKELGLPERYWEPWSFNNNRFIVYKHSGEIIWGITARIMYAVSRMIRRAERNSGSSEPL